MIDFLQSRLLWVAAALGLLVMVGGFGFVKGTAHGERTSNSACAAKIAKLDTRGNDACAVALRTLTGDYARAEAQAANAALAKQTALQETIAAADARHAQELQDAQTKSAAVVADLRAGTLRLRQQWRGCEATTGVSGTPASTSQRDAAAELRATGAGDLVRLAAEADARIRELQAIVKADRQ